MEHILDWIKVFFTAIGGYLGLFLGGCDGFLYALLVFIILDYITGLMVAIMQRKVSSEIGFLGICKKVLIFMLVAVGQIIDSKIIGQGGVIRTAIIFFYLSNEGISIIENASMMGLPIPQKLRDVLEQLKDKGERDE